ncbi:MAG: alpha-N-arabinofuranosidase [Phycisphaerae bacterium]|nr:alpha-N-arabinofuranosidase [Phycisphaerae bacterium]
MRHLRTALVVLQAVTLVAPASAENARIKIDVDRTIGEIDRNLYGNFVEHLGRCVYGGIYEPGSAQADARGFRKDVLQAIRDLGVSITRYPGGNFVSNYHWLDGVGPERTARMELAWYRLETNRFGTNEFVEFARAVGTEPYFAVNMGTGTIEEAQRWVEYCNVNEGPYYAELRRSHGYPEPHHIRYWSLGNEMDGPWQMGHLNAEDYCKKAREAAKLMRRTSPEIRLIAAGSSNYRAGADPDDWNSTVLHELRDEVDYIALHIYVGNTGNNTYNFLATPLVMEQRTRVVQGMIDREMVHANRADRGPIRIAWDEYNVWYRARGGAFARGTRALEEHYNLEDALVVAGFLNGFVRNADCIKMANMAQLVNVIAPIFTDEKTLYRQTIYYPLQLFARNVRGQALDVFVACETYDTERFLIGTGETTTVQKAVPYLDVSAAYDNGALVICVLNRHLDKAMSADILCQEGEFAGPFQVFEVNGPDVKAENDFGKEQVRTVQRPDLHASGKAITCSFPPHSFTLMKGAVKR